MNIKKYLNNCLDQSQFESFHIFTGYERLIEISFETYKIHQI